jgi:DNA topoisomerase IB
MKTATIAKRIHLPENNLWQWADEKRSARIRQQTSQETLSRRMAGGILKRFHALLGAR